MSRILIVSLGALIGVAAVVLTPRRAVQVPRPREAAVSARAASLPAALPESASTTPSTPSAPAEDPCREVREALPTQDGARIDASLDRLVSWVGGDVRRALDLVGRLSRETDPMLLEMVAAALSQDPRLGEARELVEAFLDMALRDTLPARRIAALTFLEERPRDEAAEATFLSIASRDADADVRLAAVYALRRQVDLVPVRRDRLNATLLRATDSPVGEVRASAIEALSLAEADGLQVSSVAGLLRDDVDPMVRATAAEKLGDVGPDQRVTALWALEESFLHEKDDRVRTMALVALVRAGREEAVPALRRVAGTCPSLDPVVSRLTAALSTGKADPDAAIDEAFGLAEGLPPALAADDEPACAGQGRPDAGSTR